MLPTGDFGRISIRRDSETGSMRSAVRWRQRRSPHDCHAQSQFQIADFCLWPNESEMPALGVGDEEVTEHLDARDRLEFFRINKIRIERERVRLTE